MNHYRIIITGDKYPTEYDVNASGWPTAFSRAVRMWMKRFKGSRSLVLSIRAVKLNDNHNHK